MRTESSQQQRFAGEKRILVRVWSGVACTRTVEVCEMYMKSRGRRLPTDIKSDGQTLPWKVQPETRKQILHAPCMEKLLCTNQHFSLQLAVGTRPKNNH